jgi:hypothetical protein
MTDVVSGDATAVSYREMVAQPGPMTIQRIVVCEACPVRRGGVEYLVRSSSPHCENAGYDRN